LVHDAKQFAISNMQKLSLRGAALFPAIGWHQNAFEVLMMPRASPRHAYITAARGR
jgi:hypothetical protein